MNGQGEDEVKEIIPSKQDDMSSSTDLALYDNNEEETVGSCPSSSLTEPSEILDQERNDERAEDGGPLLVDITFDPVEKFEENVRQIIGQKPVNCPSPVFVTVSLNSDESAFSETVENGGGSDLSGNGQILEFTFGPPENGLERNAETLPTLNVFLSRTEDETAISHDNMIEQLNSTMATNDDFQKQIQSAQFENDDLTEQLKTVRAERNEFSEKIKSLEVERNEILLRLHNTEESLKLAEKARATDLDAAATTRAQMDSQISDLKRALDKANQDQASIVVRFARSEKEVMDCRSEMEALTKKCQQLTKERTSLTERLAQLAADKSRLSASLDNKNMDLTVCHREIDKLKEELNSRDIKIKWVQNKLKSEMDAHKESTSTVEKLNQKVAELQKTITEKCEEIDICKKSIEDYDTFRSQEVRLKEERAKMILERHEHSEREVKLKSLQSKNEMLIEENNNLSFQVQNLEVERVSLEQKLSIAQAEAQESGNRAADLKSRLVEFDSISNQLVQEREKVEKLVVEVERLRKANEELVNDMASCRNREAEMLSFTQKLTSKNVELQSEFSNLEAKELQRELQQCRKKLEQYEAEGKKNKETENPDNKSLSTTDQNSRSTMSLPDSLQKDLSAGELVEKILRLQSKLGRRQEKIEFLEDQNASLVSQLQRRGHLLQAYVLREQAGTLSSAASDIHKAEMSKHGGIMASLYGSKSTDNSMTLELSLEINRKLQAVLEDTLLKNITLKENIDTLGDEITRLKKLIPQLGEK